ncbi:MAG: DUF4838 domain-containing protein, partial [Clostridia bacterium]|nr:DUF4838 domain-containing protein [Clostridia bacterium]
MSDIKDRLIPTDLEQEMKKSFISYAMAVIINRALPDVRDGLKPVHRRILYAMNELGMTPDKPFRKSARIVGDVLGKYHPHGDSSVYDAMVRLAQDFNIRYQLVEGQGNFGSVDGDGAAAMRYTEARMSKLTLHLLGEIDKDTVDFYPNFDETLLQPTVLPSRYPNLLVNGSSGIAVGMATNIPPHNLGEVIDGCKYMIDHPDCTVADLMQFIKGPDFPTGGIVLGHSGIRAAYNTGRGRILVRARTEIESMANNRNRIVVTEIPYMVNKARLVEKIAELVHEKRLDGISDLRDESDRNGMRIVIELKRDVQPAIVLNYLYKHTQMQDTFGVNMLALVDGARGNSTFFCISNPDLRTFVAQWAVDFFSRNPDSWSVSLEPTDGARICECDACAKLARGKTSNLVVLLANQAAEAVEKRFPNEPKYVGLLGYGYHWQPPDLRLHDRVVPLITTQHLFRMAGAALLVVVGAFDDRFGLGPRSRFVAQVVAALFLTLGCGVTLTSLGDLLGFGPIDL